MMGRALAVCGWLAWQVGRPFRATPLRRLGAAPVLVIAFALVAAAAVPIVRPLLDPQPEDASVAEIFDGTLAEPGTWVRLHGRLYRLASAPAGDSGPAGLLVDEAAPLRAIVVRAAAALGAGDPADVTAADYTGRLVEASPTVEEELPIEATVAGTPPRIVPDRIVELDAVAKERRDVPWPLAIPPLLLAATLLVGARAGYPVFRSTSVVDVLAAPLGPGERLPAAYGGRVGPNHRPLADPGGVLLLVRRGPSGSLLTAQPLPDDGGIAPQPVTIGGGWTAGRVGDVHTATETVPALVIRSELVDATFLFARTAERDRVAASVTIDR